MNPRLQKETVHQLFTTCRLLRKTTDHITGKIGWHPTQHHILFYLVDRPEPPSQREIAEFLEISPAAVTVILKKMEEIGLIEKVVSEDDIRTNRVTMTAYGRKHIMAARHVFKTTDAALLKDFNEKELSDMLIFLERLQNNMKTMDIRQIIAQGEEMLKLE